MRSLFTRFELSHPLSLSLSLHHCQASLFLSESPSLSLSHRIVIAITKPLSFYPNVSAKCRFTLTHLQIPLPIYSSHKPNTLDNSTHLTLHSITLSSNRDSQGFLGLG